MVKLMFNVYPESLLLMFIKLIYSKTHVILNLFYYVYIKLINGNTHVYPDFLILMFI